MITPKQQEVLALSWDIPKDYDPYRQKYVKNKNEFTELRRQHMLALKAQGIKISQIARVYKISRQRAHQIINGQ